MSSQEKENPAPPANATNHYGSKEREVLKEPPANPEATGFRRRSFLTGMAAVAVGGAVACNREDEADLIQAPSPTSPTAGSAPTTGGAPLAKEVPNDILAQCPYCGVGCGTLIQTEKGRIVGMKPDPKHPTNRGLQCIKGLTSAEAIYVDRLTVPLIRKDMTDITTGHLSATKGRFDESVFREATWEEAEEIVIAQTVACVEKHGGNSVGLYGSGQLPVEGQYLENVFMKGVIGSNTIEANARMCMTSAVTGYFATLGSDTPPLAYEDIELSDMIMHFGHNARESHPIIFWRAADHKKKKDIPTVVVDPRLTGTVKGYEDINPDNSVHVPILNGDISFLNSLAHVLLKDHDDVIDWDFVKEHVAGWEEYV